MRGVTDVSFRGRRASAPGQRAVPEAAARAASPANVSSWVCRRAVQPAVTSIGSWPSTGAANPCCARGTASPGSRRLLRERTGVRGEGQRVRGDVAVPVRGRPRHEGDVARRGARVDGGGRDVAAVVVLSWGEDRVRPVVAVDQQRFGERLRAVHGGVAQGVHEHGQSEGDGDVRAAHRADGGRRIGRRRDLGPGQAVCDVQGSVSSVPVARPSCTMRGSSTSA